MIARRSTLILPWLLAVSTGWAAAPPKVNESARDIPVAYRADVLVVGGGTGAVSAAVAAAEQGAKVFLAAPHPYLGDDMTATLRLWLEQGEEPVAPLARRVFSDPSQTGAGPDPNRLPFRYETDVPSAPKHKDTNPPSRLTDGRWADAPSESVQYDGDVAITADLKTPQPIQEVRLMFFRRVASTAEDNFDVKGLTVSTSDDGQIWRQIDSVESRPFSSEYGTLTVRVGGPARYVKLAVRKPEAMTRTLLGEIEIVAPAPDAPATPVAKLPPPRPMHVKKTLDDVLLAAGVEFLYSCYATDVLRDAAGNPSGIAMANRAGRQAVVAKTIVDATDRGLVARLAGAKFRPYPSGAHTFRRVVIGGEAQTGENLASRIITPPFRGPYPNQAGTSGGTFEIIEYTLRLAMHDDGYASWAAAEQQARTMTYHPEQQFTSDVLFEVPPDAMHGRQSVDGPWTGVENVSLGAFQPAEVPRVYVLGGCADVSRPQAEKLLRPLALIDLGARLGKAAAAEAKSLPAPGGVKLPGAEAPDAVATGEIREILRGVRPTQELPTIRQDARALPVLGRYDVVVIGGGTGGAPAGIAAARQGAKTLVVEYLHGLGGVGTMGAISKYYWGNRVGFTATIPGGGSWVIEQKMEWYRTELLKAGADVWFGTIGCGAMVHNQNVVGAVVVTPGGRGVVLAKTVIDATGNADMAAAAGAECIYTDASEFGMQGTGLPGRRLGGAYNNTDFTITDETDLVDVWQMFVYSKNKYPDAFDHGRLIDTRERRRIVGDFTITLPDQVNERTHHDSVVRAWSNFDTHGYTIDPYLLLEHPEHRGIGVYIPYRSMLPKGLDGILVIGLGISAHRDAVPLIRMQPDIQNGGYAAGVAAAMAAEQGTAPRNIDVRKLQEHLVEIDNLPSSVLEDEDSYPLPDEKIAEAVASIKEGRPGAAVILTHPQKALPMLEKAFAEAEGPDKLAYARALGVMGRSTGLELLVAEVRKTPQWDQGWNYRGMGQFGAALSPLDNLIVAAGRTGQQAAVPAILEKAELLTAAHDFSHHRAVGLALELIGDPAAAAPLAALLKKPGISGHVQTTVDEAIQRGAPGGTNAEQTRRESLRELLLARALYRCGDDNGLGKKTLEAYTKDLRGHLARHAKAVLEAGASQ
ncbi:MAG: FAD-dependent oxidoreductase [Pirellulales bacterium]|nr:FAD-dependent oxidoreductase [Pirellulales bacterium]